MKSFRVFCYDVDPIKDFLLSWDCFSEIAPNVLETRLSFVDPYEVLREVLCKFRPRHIHLDSCTTDHLCLFISDDFFSKSQILLA